MFKWCLLQLTIADTCAAFAPPCLFTVYYASWQRSVPRPLLQMHQLSVSQYFKPFTISIHLTDLEIALYLKLLPMLSSSVRVDNVPITSSGNCYSIKFLQYWTDTFGRIGFCHWRLAYIATDNVCTLVFLLLALQVWIISIFIAYKECNVENREENVDIWDLFGPWSGPEPWS